MILARAARHALPRSTRALSALILYVAAALLLPALHLSRHEQPHEHLPHGLRLHPLGAAHLYSAPGDHGHAAEHDQPHSHPPDPVPEQRLQLLSLAVGKALLAPPPSHGSLAGHGLGSLAHFAAGYLAVELPVVPPAWARLALPPPRPLTREVPRSAPHRGHAPRAPPASLG